MSEPQNLPLTGSVCSDQHLPNTPPSAPVTPLQLCFCESSFVDFT